MKITKAMGRACLREMEAGKYESAATKALLEIGWNKGEGHFDWIGGNIDVGQEQTALAMCAAIAGVSHAR